MGRDYFFLGYWFYPLVVELPPLPREPVLAVGSVMPVLHRAFVQAYSVQIVQLIPKSRLLLQPLPYVQSLQRIVDQMLYLAAVCLKPLKGEDQYGVGVDQGLSFLCPIGAAAMAALPSVLQDLGPAHFYEAVSDGKGGTVGVDFSIQESRVQEEALLPAKEDSDTIIEASFSLPLINLNSFDFGLIDVVLRVILGNPLLESLSFLRFHQLFLEVAEPRQSYHSVVPQHGVHLVLHQHQRHSFLFRLLQLKQHQLHIRLHHFLDAYFARGKTVAEPAVPKLLGVFFLAEAQEEIVLFGYLHLLLDLVSNVLIEITIARPPPGIILAEFWLLLQLLFSTFLSPVKEVFLNNPEQVVESLQVVASDFVGASVVGLGGRQVQFQSRVGRRRHWQRERQEQVEGVRGSAASQTFDGGVLYTSEEVVDQRMLVIQMVPFEIVFHFLSIRGDIQLTRRPKHAQGSPEILMDSIEQMQQKLMRVLLRFPREERIPFSKIHFELERTDCQLSFSPQMFQQISKSNYNRAITGCGPGTTILYLIVRCLSNAPCLQIGVIGRKKLSKISGNQFEDHLFSAIEALQAGVHIATVAHVHQAPQPPFLIQIS